MDKWMLIVITNRELEPIRMFDTAEEAQEAMKNDFTNTVGIEDFHQVCATNGGLDCEDWQFGDYDAWISNMDCFEWHIAPITV